MCWPRFLCGALAAVVVLAALACGKPERAPATAASEEHVLTTKDGLAISATLYTVPKPAPPALILVHMLGSDRHSWAAFASRAEKAGYLCAAIDLRGHGDRVGEGGRTRSYRTFTQDDWYAALNDIAAAKDLLLRKGADPENLAVVGASIGANLALNYAVEDPAIQAIVLISPGLDYHGIATEPAMRSYVKRPSLLVTAEGDAYAAASAQTLKRIAPAFCELREYPGAAHGTNLINASDEVVDQILYWLDTMIGAQHRADAAAQSKENPAGKTPGR